MSSTIETDFLVVGAGAMGLAFADEVMRSNRRLRVTLVDRRAGPGGHWNDAYDFVRLHQPAAFYGVNSAPLGSGGEDLANKPEILAYFQRVIDRWSATGRLRFLPQCDFGEDGVVRSVVGDAAWQVKASQPIVDATFSQVQVPATHPPKYAVDPDARLVPVGGLWRLAERHPRYVVIGAGKTGIDALLYLLDRGVAPDRLTWIVSRDSWLFDRAPLQPRTAGEQVIAQLRTIAESDSPADAYDRLEAGGWWLRIDETREPAMFRCATVSREELAALRSVEHVVRLGRVQRVEPERLVLDGGELAIEPGALFIDCTADGLVRREPTPVFTAERITLQPVFVCQQVMSSAAIAAMAIRPGDDAWRNTLTRPVPHPDVPHDYIGALSATFDNLLEWLKVPWLAWWSGRTRLSAVYHLPLVRRVALLGSLNRIARHAKDRLRALSVETPADSYSAPGS